MAHAAEVLIDAPTGLPRLVANTSGTESLTAHMAGLGPMPLASGRRRAVELIGIVERSGLRGRGGSGFPTATKMRAVAGGRGARVVIANGSEGEPASAKDAWLLTIRPHLVLDGAALAAQAVNANDVVIALDRHDGRTRAAVARALEERRAARVDEVRMRAVDLPSRYVAGEESALVHWVNGGEAKPTFVPPRPFERGVRGRATLIQNVETLAHLALIARFGADWFREVGTATEPGTAIVTVGGAVARPGVCEIAIGTPLRDAVAAAGGPSEDIAAFLTGGYFGTWIRAESAWDLPLGHLELGRVGAAFGCGVVFALPAGACGLAETARVARYPRGGERRTVRTLRLRPRRDRRRARRHRGRSPGRAHDWPHPPLDVADRRSGRVPSARRRDPLRGERARHVRARARAPPRSGRLRGGAPTRSVAAPGSGRPRARLAMTEVLRINPLRCDAQGLCAELFPEWISYDDWGYPIIRHDAIPPHLREHACRAVSSCPRVALAIVEQ